MSIEVEQDDYPVTPTQWLGLYPGVVVSTEDPDKRGHVRVRVPQVYGDPLTEDEFIQDSMLPWARPSMPLHDYHADFEVGDGVWVSFWGGASTEPIWHGQFLGTGDAPDEFTSSYTPRPMTRILRTSNGHLIEMRWVKGEEKIRIRTAGGVYIELEDVGPSALVQTPAGIKFQLSDATNKAIIETATSKVEVDESGGVINIHTAGSVDIGSAAAGKLAAVLEPFLSQKYDLHTHTYDAPLHLDPVQPGVSSAPTPLHVPATDLTQSVVMN